MSARGDFSYLEVGSHHDGTLESLIADPRCRRIVSIRMQAGEEGVDPEALSADLCFIGAHHTNAAALKAAQLCREAIRSRGVIVFQSRTRVDRGIRLFLGTLTRYRAYPLANELFVVELGVASFLSDAAVRARVPRRSWLLADRLRVMRPALQLGAFARGARLALGQTALMLAAPRRRSRSPNPGRDPGGGLFEIHTFVNDDSVYERMRRSFVDAGFSPDALVRLDDGNDDPFAAITRIGRESTVRYPILCHQDVLPEQGPGAAELERALEHLDAIDPDWVVAGNAGVMRSGRVLRRLVDAYGGSTGESLPLPVVTLDGNFLVFNGRNGARCSPGVSGFHLYGSDVCLHALASGGSAYVIDFPVKHLGQGKLSPALQTAKASFIAAWNEQCRFRYVLTTFDVFVIGRSKMLRRVFGSSWAMACVAHCCRQYDGVPLRTIDRMAARPRTRTRRILRGAADV